MREFWKSFRFWLWPTGGPTLVEYAMAVLFVIILVVTGIQYAALRTTLLGHHASPAAEAPAPSAAASDLE